MNLANIIEPVKIIAKFQAIEAALKILITQKLIKIDKLSGTEKESYTIDELDDLPYGQLLKRFKIVFGQDDGVQQIHTKLLALKDTRNYFAHKSLLAESSLPEQTKKFIRVDTIHKFDYKTLNDDLDSNIYQLCSMMRHFSS